MGSGSCMGNVKRRPGASAATAAEGSRGEGMP